MGFTAHRGKTFSGLGWREPITCIRRHGSIPALYLYGNITGPGIFRSRTEENLGQASVIQPIGKDPKVMEASRQKFASFHRYYGRGIYYGLHEESREEVK